MGRGILNSFEEHKSAIDFAPMTDLDHQHDEPLILDFADDAIVADAVAPVPAKDVPFQRRAKFSGIFVCRDTLFKK